MNDLIHFLSIRFEEPLRNMNQTALIYIVLKFILLRVNISVNQIVYLVKQSNIFEPRGGNSFLIDAISRDNSHYEVDCNMLTPSHVFYLLFDKLIHPCVARQNP